MVMTSQAAKNQRAKQIAAGARPEDLARKFMSKADVLAEKKARQEKKEYLVQKAQEYDAAKVKTTVATGTESEVGIKSTKVILSEEKQARIEKLNKEKEKMMGPGSRARKEAIDKAIADLEGKE